MEKKRNILKIYKVLFALLLVGGTDIALGSFTGTTENKAKDLYSLKNFNKNFYRSASPFSLRAGFEYSGIKLLTVKNEASGDLSLSSMMRFEKGNTTYIYPYKHKVTVPKFKTPMPPSIR
jgi:hypothetical protein